MKLDKQVKSEAGIPTPTPTADTEEKGCDQNHSMIHGDGVDRLCSLQKGCSRLSSPFRVWYKESDHLGGGSLTGEKEKMKRCSEMKRQAGWVISGAQFLFQH